MILTRLAALAIASALSLGYALAQTSPSTVPKGGTGRASFTAGCIPYGAGTAALACDAPGATSGVQPYDADLAAIAALSGTSTIYYRSAANTWTAVTIGGLLSFSGGTLNVGDADLAAIAGLTSANNKCFYFTGSGTAATFDCSSFGRSFINVADASAGRTSLGLVINTDVQAYDLDLAALAANSTDGFWAHTGAGTGAARTFTAPAAGFTITNPAGIAGNPTFVLANDLAALEGLSSTGYAARTTTDTWAQRTFQAGTGMGVTNGDGVSGNTSYAITDVELLAIAGLTSAADKCPYWTGSGTAANMDCVTYGRSLLNAANAGALRTLAGLVLGTDAQAYHAALAALSSTIADDQVFVGSGSNTGAWKTLPDCTDTGGNHLNYNQSTNAFACGNSSSGGGGGSVATDDYLQMMLNSMDAARSQSLARFMGYRFADSFGATTYVNTGAATNLDSGTAGLLKPSAGSATLVSNSCTTLGNLTGGGGLAAAVDANTSQAQSAGAASAGLGASNAGYNNTAGCDWGSGNSKIIGRITVYSPNNVGICGGGACSTTWKLQGSTDNFSSSIVDLYTSGSTSVGGNDNMDVTSGITTTTAYRYHRINVNGNAVNTVSLAEIRLYEAGVTNNVTAQSTSIAVPANPATCVLYARVKHVDSATVGTDYNFYVSRDGGTTFSSAASMTDYFTDPTDSAHVLYSASVGVSGQPSGANVVLKLITANNKMVELRDWGLRCAA